MRLIDFLLHSKHPSLALSTMLMPRSWALAVLMCKLGYPKLLFFLYNPCLLVFGLGFLSVGHIKNGSLTFTALPFYRCPDVKDLNKSYEWAFLHKDIDTWGISPGVLIWLLITKYLQLHYFDKEIPWIIWKLQFLIMVGCLCSYKLVHWCRWNPHIILLFYTSLISHIISICPLVI